MSRKKGKIFIISGPGGAGKTTLVKKLFESKDVQKKFIKAVTVTTREKREGEEDGKDYFFVSKEEFLKLKKDKFFLESQKILENYYGTPKIVYNIARKKNKDLILCIDVNGGIHLKKNVKTDKIITTFVLAPTKEELLRRMEKRQESKGVIKSRINLAKKEVRLSKGYDHVIINEDITKTIKQLEKVVLEK